MSPGPKEPRVNGCKAHGTSQLVPTYVYPVQQVQYGSPGGYGAQPPGSPALLYPWDYYGGQIIEYHDLNFSSGQSPCACQDLVQIQGTLRGRPKCKKCRKPRTANNNHWSPPVNQHHSQSQSPSTPSLSSSPYAKKLQQQEGIAPVPKKNLVYRDPYEYHGSFSRKFNATKSAEDEWQSYWDQDGDDADVDFVDTKAVVPFAPSGLASKIRPRSKSPEPFRHLRVRKPNGHQQDLKVVERAIAAQQLVKTLSAASRNLSTFSPLKRSTEPSPEVKDPESSESEIYEKVNDQKDQKPSKAAEEISRSGEAAGSPQPARKQGLVEPGADSAVEALPDEKPSAEVKEAEEKAELDAEVVADDADDADEGDDLDRGLIDDATRRKLIEDAESLLLRSELRRPKKLRSSDYRLRRKYQRRKNSGSSSGSGSSNASSSFLIDEVILEEDEEALEAENLEVISSRPAVPVKSILKRPSPTSASSSSDDSESDAPKSLRDETDAETEAESSTVRRRKKGVTFNDGNMGNVASSEQPTTKRLFSGDELNIATPASHSSRSSQSSQETEDELTGYSKVVVSHNLAEEILDEIYGKLAQVQPPPDDGGQYENSDFFSSAATPFFLFQETGSEAPRSLADEILDELYGGDEKCDDDDDDDKSNKRNADEDDNDYYEEIRDVSGQPGNDAKSASENASKPSNVNPVLAGESNILLSN